MRRARQGLIVTCMSAALSVACAPDAEQVFAPMPDAMRFANEVYPVLLRDCGFVACHGASGRPFQVFGPGRARVGPVPADVPEGDLTYPVQALELQISYDRARSMLTRLDRQALYLLLAKPLEQSAGGVGHRGDDDQGRNVYASQDDPNWQLLNAWAQAAGESVTP